MAEKSFPIQADWSVNAERLPVTQIPWWLAKEAYEYYVELFGSNQSLERLAERGGFGRDELLRLLRKEHP